MIRTITGSKHNTRTEPLSKSFDLLKIKDVSDLRTFKFYYRCVHDNLHVCF